MEERNRPPSPIRLCSKASKTNGGRPWFEVEPGGMRRAATGIPNNGRRMASTTSQVRPRMSVFRRGKTNARTFTTSRQGDRPASVPFCDGPLHIENIGTTTVYGFLELFRSDHYADVFTGSVGWRSRPHELVAGALEHRPSPSSAKNPETKTPNSRRLSRCANPPPRT